MWIKKMNYEIVEHRRLCKKRHFVNMNAKTRMHEMVHKKLCHIYKYIFVIMFVCI